jgi:TRAP-type C4-dicarboxylate transport system permease small subunit
VLRYLNTFEGIVVPLVMGLMSLITIAQVFFRYVVAYSLDWPEELGRYLFIIAVYLGTSLAERYDRHLAVTILRTNGNRFISRMACLAGPFFTVVFSLLMVVWGIKMTYFVYETEQLAPAMQFPMFYLYAVIPFGLFCMGIHGAVNFCRVLDVLPDSEEDHTIRKSQ